MRRASRCSPKSSRSRRACNCACLPAPRMFFAIWAGIVLLAIVLPPHLRVPVLAAVWWRLFVVGGVARAGGCESQGRFTRRGLDDLVPRQPEARPRSVVARRSRKRQAAARNRSRHRRRRPKNHAERLMISPLERARLLDAEMQLQRAWLELNLRELSSAARGSPWGKLNAAEARHDGNVDPQTSIVVAGRIEPADESLPAPRAQGE